MPIKRIRTDPPRPRKPKPAPRQRAPRRAPEAVRQEIIDAAAWFLENRPFGELTVGKLMEHTKISRPAFYIYFQDIESLVGVVVDGIVAEVRSYNARWVRAQTDPEQAMTGALTDIVNLWVRKGAMFSAILDAAIVYPTLTSAVDGVMAAYESDIRHLLKREREAGRAAFDDDGEVATFLVRATQAYLRNRHGADGFADPLKVHATLRAMWQRILYAR